LEGQVTLEVLATPEIMETVVQAEAEAVLFYGVISLAALGHL
jgi:hypothetical protein